MQLKATKITYLFFILTLLQSTVSYADNEEGSKNINNCNFEVPQEGRGEPKYKGLSGFLVFKNSERVFDPYKKLPTPPWEVTSLEQVGPQKWERKGKKFASKTPVTVIEQNLKHRRHGFYSGTLTVKLHDTNEEIKIFPDNFTPVKYWECKPEKAVAYSFFIAEIKNPEAKATSKDGKWEEIGKEKKVFCTGKDNWDSKRNVKCFLYKKYKYGYGGIEFKFSPNDLKIIY